jgi:DNA-binding HxlR family transcriptional regulator
VWSAPRPGLIHLVGAIGEDAVETAPTGNSSFRQDAEEALSLLSGDWSVAVLVALSLGELHFVEVQRAVNEIEQQFGFRRHTVRLSSKVLSRVLDRLEEDGLLVRHDEAQMKKLAHPSVLYELTPAGQAMVVALRPLAEWARRHRPAPPQPMPD